MGSPNRLTFMVQDLRNKNWKAMEAISTVEKNLESKEKQIQKITSVSDLF